MPRYRVHSIATVSAFIGEFEADNEDEALAMAAEQGNWPGGLCHQCGENFDLGDWYEDQADLITETQPQT